MTVTDDVRRWRKKNPEKARALRQRYSSKPEVKKHVAEYQRLRKIQLAQEPVLSERVKRLMVKFGAESKESIT